MGNDEPLAGVDSGEAALWLTSRQAEVLRLATAGLVAKEIARRLGISIRTVEGHFGVMRQRTGARNMAELAAWGVARGIAQHQAEDGDTGDAADAVSGPAEAHP
ncbi:MAG TPA: helix-turn-helix transcriptional regulator [Trebonia sp.]|nr:helix-turn-helix transcriptional regulator [Trebonia sp.]